MKILGIIVEYNPFHNGHLYQVRMAKKITGADYTVVVMSGNYVQRGIPAIINKYDRTWMCLDNEIDLVIELPVCYATASAEYFAHGAVTLLESLGIVDYLCFGSECDNLQVLQTISDIFAEGPEYYNSLLQNLLKLGDSFPVARTKALCDYLTVKNLIHPDELSYYRDILSSPNCILAIEYLKVLKIKNSKIAPIIIKRIGSGHLSEKMQVSYSSATAIRNSIQAGNELSILYHNVPPNVYKKIHDKLNIHCPVNENDFSVVLGDKLLLMTADELTDFFDVTPELANRIQNNVFHYKNFRQFSLLIKTRGLTLTRINRALLHILLDIKQKELQSYLQGDVIFYIRILGFKKASSDLLTTLKEKTKLPIITKLADAKYSISPDGLGMLNNNIYADHLYRLVTMHKFNESLPNEYTGGLIIR